MIHLRVVALLAAALALSVPPVRSQAVDIPIPDIPYTRFVLKNGLTLLVHEDHKLPVVAVNTWYHVGSKNETPGKTGFAHLFEHLMFSGSENFNQAPYLAAMSGIGATSLNGTTNPDRTNYFQNVPTSMLDYTLFVESDRMGHFLGALDQKKLDLQRGVVQNEKRQGQNQPYGVLREILPPALYPPGHPYSWPVIGSMKDLDAASMADVQEWFRTYYGPNNTTLVLAGDITPAVALEKVEKYYGDIPAGPPLARHEAWVAKRSGTHRAQAQDRVAQARLYRIWNVPGAYTPEAALLDLGAQILGGGKTSRLSRRLVYKDQVATSATATNDVDEIGGQFDFTLTARPGGNLAMVEQAADEELRALLRSGPTASELALARSVILARFARIAERVGGFGGKSDLLASCMTYTGKPDCYKEHLQRIKAATPESVKQALNAWLSDGDYVLSVSPLPSATTTAAMDRSKGPQAGKAEALKLPPMRKAVLSNGLKLVLAESHGAPVVNVSLLVDGGYAADPAQLPGLTSLTLKMMEEGTATRGAMRLAEELEALGAGITTTANLDGMFINLNTLKATLPQAVAVYSDLVLHPAFAPAELERVRKDQLAAIQREKANPQTMATRVLPALLYGKGHPYANPATGSGTEAALARVTRDDLVNYHRAWIRPNNATLLVVGDTTLAELTPLLEKAFAGWQAGEVPKKNVAPVRPPQQTVVYLMDRPGAQQSVIYGAQLAQPADAQELVHLQIVNNIFGGTFSSRINMNLREDKHWSYGVRSDVLPSQGQRSFVSRSPVQTDKTSEALQELVREYKDMAGARPIGEQELKAAQERETLGLPGMFETAAQMANAYANILQYRLPENYYDTFTQTATSLTPAQANAVAARAIVPGQLTWVVVGDMSKVEAGIRELKLGEVRRIDADGNPVQ